MTQAKELKFVVVTPEKKLVEDTARAIVIPMRDGELGILPNRAALMCELGVGQMRYTKEGRTRRLYIDGGFAQVLDNQVTVLTTRGAPAEEITFKMITEAEAQVKAEAAECREDLEPLDLARRRASVLRKLYRGRA